MNSSLSSATTVQTTDSARDQSILPLARQFLGYLHTDEGQQAQEAARIAQLAAKHNNMGLAKMCIEATQGWRRSWVSHEVASAMAASGALPEAKELLAELPYPPDSAPAHASLQVTLARADALARCGRPAEAVRLLEGLPPSPDKWKAVASMVHLLDTGAADSFLKQMTEAGDAVAPVLRGTALIGRAEIHFRDGEKDEGLNVMDEALSTLGKKFSPLMIDEFCRGARLLVDQGEKTKALVWARAAKTVVLTLSPKASWRAGKLRACAQALEIAGSPEDSRECLRLAREAVLKDDIMGFPESAATAALVAHEAGDAAAIQTASLEIMKVSSRHPHHRARAMAVLEVIGLHVKAGIPLSPEVTEGIEAMAGGIQADPNYRK